jgi:hypothetical protein
MKKDWPQRGTKDTRRTSRKAAKTQRREERSGKQEGRKPGKEERVGRLSLSSFPGLLSSCFPDESLDSLRLGGFA